VERFEVWYGGIFVVMGLIAFVIAGLLYGGLGRATRRRGGLWDVLATPLTIGALFTVLGSVFAGYGLWKDRVERNVMENGVTVRAYVRGPEPTLTRVNGAYLWRIKYQYQDQTGQAQEASTGFMSPDEAQLWKSAEVAFVKYDPARPSDSVWLGIREDSPR